MSDEMRRHGPGGSDGDARLMPRDATATPHIGKALAEIIAAEDYQPGSLVVIIDANVYPDGDATYTWRSLRGPQFAQRSGSLPAPGRTESLPGQYPTT